MCSSGTPAAAIRARRICLGDPPRIWSTIVALLVVPVAGYYLIQFIDFKFTTHGWRIGTLPYFLAVGIGAVVQAGRAGGERVAAPGPTVAPAGCSSSASVGEQDAVMGGGLSAMSENRLWFHR
jgi:peptidoglycan/LPS O-acetylase OafA/YrhL